MLKERGPARSSPRWRPGSRRSTRTTPTFEHQRLEALWTYQALDVVEPDLLGALLDVARPPRPGGGGPGRPALAATAAPTRWRCWRRGSRTTTRASGSRRSAPWRTSPSPQSAELALRALDRPVDRFLDYALWLTARELAAALAARGRRRAGSTSAATRGTWSSPSRRSARPTVRQAAARACSGRAECPPSEDEGVLTLIAALGGPHELAWSSTWP